MLQKYLFNPLQTLVPLSSISSFPYTTNYQPLVPVREKKCPCLLHCKELTSFLIQRLDNIAKSAATLEVGTHHAMKMAYGLGD